MGACFRLYPLMGTLLILVYLHRGLHLQVRARPGSYKARKVVPGSKGIRGRSIYLRLFRPRLPHPPERIANLLPH
jgi:hypothetical protein